MSLGSPMDVILRRALARRRILRAPWKGLWLNLRNRGCSLLCGRTCLVSEAIREGIDDAELNHSFVLGS